jgi:hypothetical protein
MSVHAIQYETNLTLRKARRIPRRVMVPMRPKLKHVPPRIVTAPPFTRAAEVQAAAIRTGRIPKRGAVLDITV